MTVRAHTMFTTYDPATNAVITAATVNIYNPGTVTPISATIFDKLGNPLSNPLTSDATTGLIDFYLTVAQEVDVVVSKSGFTTRTYSNVPVLDDSSLELTALLTNTGDLPYASSANTPQRLPIGTNGNMMYVNAGIPAYNANANINSNGNMALGTTPVTNASIKISSIVSGSTTELGIIAQPVGDTSGTSEVSAFYGNPTTSASAYTLTTAACFHATPVAKGAGSTITSAYGLLVDAQISGNTNNYGVYINAPSSGSGNNFGLYNAGTTELVGQVGMGTVPVVNMLLKIQGPTSVSTTQIGVTSQPTGDSNGTTEITAFYGNPTSFAGAYTLATATCFHATPVAKGAGSTITNAYGMLIDSQTVGGTANYGIVISAPSGGATANVGIQVASVGSGAGNAALQIVGGDVLLGPTGVATNATAGFVFLPACAGAPTGTPANAGAPMIYDTTNNKIWVRNGGTWRGVVVT